MISFSRPILALIAFGIAALFLGNGRAPAAPRRVQAGPNVFLEIDGARRRVIFTAVVVLREGLLEQLLCRKNTKEHEAILAADCDARDLHKALLITGAKPGSTVRYEPKFEPPSGTPITVTLSYEKDGKTIRLPGQDWVRDVKTKKSLAAEWVFAGSYFQPNPLDPKGPPLYGANSGDVICVSNFGDAMLDLPFASTSDNSELEFEAFTDRIPPLGTTVTVTLEPASAKQK
jgi:hypothetical protein